MSKLQNDLQELGLKPNEIKVYLALTRQGEATASQVAKKAGLARTTTISILDKLKGEGYLTAHRHRGVTSYWIESPRTLVQMLETKLATVVDLEDNLRNLYRSESGFPSAEVYDTKKSIQNFIERVINSLDKKDVIKTIDSPSVGNYEKIFSENISKVLLTKKASRGIKTRTLIPFATYNKIDKKKIQAQPIEIRELPVEIKFDSSIWLVGKSLVLFSGSPPFAVAVTHKSVVTSWHSIYEFLWKVSIPKDN